VNSKVVHVKAKSRRTFQVCSHFDADHYSKVQAAYRLLGKTQMAMDQLHMHFASAIHNAAFNVVHGYVELCFNAAQAESVAGASTFHKKQYKQLCQVGNVYLKQYSLDGIGDQAGWCSCSVDNSSFSVNLMLSWPVIAVMCSWAVGFVRLEHFGNCHFLHHMGHY
jgi:hypothetical protein